MIKFDPFDRKWIPRERLVVEGFEELFYILIMVVIVHLSNLG